MKTFSLFLLFIAFSLNVKAQEPTKEQTIKWIKETIETYYAHGKIKNLEVTPCQISYNNVAGKNYIVAPINTNLIVNYDDVNKIVDVDYKDKKLKIITDKDGEKTFYKNLISLVGNDADIGNRMVKAIKHLATFCTKEESPF